MLKICMYALICMCNVCARPYVYATYLVYLPKHMPSRIRGYAPDLTCPPACLPTCI